MPKAIFAGQEGASQLARHALEKVTFLQTGGPAHTAIKSSLGRHLLSQHPLNPFDGSIIAKKFISRALSFTCEAKGKGNTVGGMAFVLMKVIKLRSPYSRYIRRSNRSNQPLLYDKDKAAIKKLKINLNFCKY